MDDTGASLLDWLKAGLQYLLPQHVITRTAHWLTRVETPAVKNWLMRNFIRHFNVDMSEAAEPDSRAYPSFNAFFTRALHAGARPISPEAESIACPVDGTVSQSGNIEHDSIFQAKGRDFTTQELLGDASLADLFTNGEFATLYLSPRDYHRIHMPLDGTLQNMLHIPGRLFSVNPPTTRVVPELFARNERVVTVFETLAGPMAVVMVGALNVASIETVWAGEITPPRSKQLRAWKYQDNEIALKKGTELGRFNMGSTVILLFGQDRTRWNAELGAGAGVHMGQRIG
ncbi:MAG: archaetidylserine decarboxylase, partial [Gammaproteobacteria bacterium]